MILIFSVIQLYDYANRKVKKQKKNNSVSIVTLWIQCSIFVKRVRALEIWSASYTQRGWERWREWGLSDLTPINVSKEHKNSLMERKKRGFVLDTLYIETLLTNPTPLLLITLVCTRGAAHPICWLWGAGCLGLEVNTFSDRWLLGDGCQCEQLGV